MRRFISWAMCSAICMQAAAVTAQQYSPIKPNYGRSVKRVASNTLPSPGQSMMIGSGVANVTIPQQGSVNLGTGGISTSAPAPASVPSYSYAPASAMSSPAPYSPQATSSCATGNCAGNTYGHGHAGGAYDIGPACSDCGSSNCVGGCKLGKLKSLLGRKHLGHGGHSHGGWFGGMYYMRLWRSGDSFDHPLAFDSANPTNTVLATGFARMESANGLGVRLGKMLSNCSAIEFIYWQAFPSDKTAVADQAFVGAPVSSTINFNSLSYDNLAGGGGAPVNDFFQDAQYTSVTRSYDYSNFEINFLKLPFVYGGNSRGRARVALLAGARYFRAAEDLEYFSDDLNNIPHDDPANELQLHTELDNHLVGFQLGCLFDYQFTCRLSGQIGSKVGIYNNHMRHVQSVTGGAGGATITAGPYAGQVYGLDTKKDDVAFLGEIDAGLAYCVNSNWRLTSGYKVLGISGYADPTKQIARSFDDLGAAGLIYNNDSLILHGAYVGAEYCW